jgi:hypothetical protein
MKGEFVAAESISQLTFHHDNLFLYKYQGFFYHFFTSYPWVPQAGLECSFGSVQCNRFSKAFVMIDFSCNLWAISPNACWSMRTERALTRF